MFLSSKTLVTTKFAPEKRLEEMLDRLESNNNAVAIPVDESLSYLRGKRVLVTGAGGSIGTQLCLYLKHIGVGHIFALGHGGGSLLKLSKKLDDSFPHDRVIADVADPISIRAAFKRFRPQVVVHLAAIKHQDVLEENVNAAIQINVKGTKIVVESALENEVELLIFVSSDKAVNPTSIYGCSKRLGEMIITSHAYHPFTKMLIVRFGNVFGSDASVVDLFKRQLAAGDPVTVTHPDVNRWFMEIDDAAMLLCYAGALGDDGGGIFVLDMGEPIRIVDLARTLIKRSGRTDVQIKFIGLRPGEKLTEELFTEQEMERRVPTEHPPIWKVKPEEVDRVRLGGMIAELIFFAEEGYTDAVRSKLQEIIPEYVPDYVKKAA